MKAILCPRYGSADVLRLAELDKPLPKKDEVLIRVYATTVNRTDCAILSAKPFIMRFFIGLLKPRNPVLGTEFAGRVEAVGQAVRHFQVGDKVFGFDDQCLASHAQYMTLAEDKALATMPDDISYIQAAASIEGAHYAYNMLNKVKLKRGQKALLNGASGGIGSAAVQLLQHFSVEITAVTNTRNMLLVQALGASRVIDDTQADFTQEAQQYDYIFDTVGKSSFGQCKSLLKPHGVYISSELGWMAQNIFLALLTPLLAKKKVVFPMPLDIPASVSLLKQLMTQGLFTAVVDRTYALEHIADGCVSSEDGGCGDYIAA